MTATPEEIGQLIREARKRKGLTQKELGEKMGITESAVNRLEGGERSLNVQTLARVAEALSLKLKIALEEE